MLSPGEGRTRRLNGVAVVSVGVHGDPIGLVAHLFRERSIRRIAETESIMKPSAPAPQRSVGSDPTAMSIPRRDHFPITIRADLRGHFAIDRIAQPKPAIITAPPTPERPIVAHPACTDEARQETGCLLLVEEALHSPEFDEFIELLKHQPEWSEVARHHHHAPRFVESAGLVFHGDRQYHPHQTASPHQNLDLHRRIGAARPPAPIRDPSIHRQSRQLFGHGGPRSQKSTGFHKPGNPYVG